MYQGLKKFIPADESTAVDDRSLHFLDFPTPREEYFDDEIERSVGRMQAVIELGRNIREKNTISLKVKYSTTYYKWHRIYQLIVPL
jgi:isoleucyl-tRNA synthetase